MAAGAAEHPWFTLREGDQLSKRVDTIDRDGTRGMQLLSAQTQENTAAIARMETTMQTRFAEHTRQHTDELAALRIRNRWRVGTSIAAAAVLVAILSVVVEIAFHVHS